MQEYAISCNSLPSHGSRQGCQILRKNSGQGPRRERNGSAAFSVTCFLLPISGEIFLSPLSIWTTVVFLPLMYDLAGSLSDLTHKRNAWKKHLAAYFPSGFLREIRRKKTNVARCDRPIRTTNKYFCIRTRERLFLVIKSDFPLPPILSFSPFHAEQTKRRRRGEKKVILFPRLPLLFSPPRSKMQNCPLDVSIQTISPFACSLLNWSPLGRNVLVRYDNVDIERRFFFLSLYGPNSMSVGILTGKRVSKSPPSLTSERERERERIQNEILSVGD